MGKKINAHKVLVGKCQREIGHFRPVGVVGRITFAFHLFAVYSTTFSIAQIS
jgi:hypothetical protein